MSIDLIDGKLVGFGKNDRFYRFRGENEHAGPVFHIVYAGQERIGSEMRAGDDGWYGVTFWGVSLKQRVTETDDGIRIDAILKNESSQVFRPDRVSLELGLDTYMDRYPDWNSKYFPTMLRCERTHAWGYFRSPDGNILGVASPDPITSWALEYNHFFCDNGHRIYTVRFDLVSKEPQPPRHPVVNCVMPGEEQRCSIYLYEAASITDVVEKASRVCHAPTFYSEKLTVEKDEPVKITIFSETKPELSEGEAVRVSPDRWEVTLRKDACGLYELTAETDGKISDVSWYVRRPWSFYLDAARRAAIDMPQKTGSHCESWYGFFSAFQAAYLMPDSEKDRIATQKFEELLPLSFDIAQGRPITIPHRIQNTAIAVSLCEDAWLATKDEKWLDIGARLADHLIDNCQRDDGVFCSSGTHYTCVIYIAKSILELWLAERTVPGREDRAKKHFDAAKRAIDELVLHLDNIGTEGEHTFEDGMISCSVTQIAMMALFVPADADERERYVKAAQTMLSKHRCLERLGSVDARSRNTTLRFWEAQYDVLIPANMINSPHGWSAWKIYGVWYLYLATGKVEYLIDAMETLGSCMQLVDADGRLRWSFVPDPCIQSGIWKNDGTGNGYLERCTFGETYVDMISGWYRAPEDTAVFGYLGKYGGFATDEGGCCDNDVHECFKALAEAALPYAYIYQQGEEIKTINGSFENGVFIPAESLVRAVHVNLKQKKRLKIRFGNKEVTSDKRFGWIACDENEALTKFPLFCDTPANFQ